MGRKAHDVTGQTFGRLTVLGLGHPDARGKRRMFCRCECGNRCEVYATDLRKGSTKSCGCYRRHFIRENQRARWAHHRALLPDVPIQTVYQPDHTLSRDQQRVLARELARVAAHEGEPARENFRWRAWLNPHLAPALPAETGQVAA